MSRKTHREKRRTQILDAACVVFGQKGYHDLRIQDVADEAGVAYGLVYHYFKNKDTLLQTVFDEQWEQFADAVDGIEGSERTTVQKLDTILRYAYNAARSYPDRVRVVVLEFGRTPRLREVNSHPLVRRAGAAVLRLFEKAEAEGLLTGADPLSLTVLFLGALESSLAASFMSFSVDRDVQLKMLERSEASLRLVLARLLVPQGS